MRSALAAANRARRPSSSHRTTCVPLYGTAWGNEHSNCRRLIRLAPGIWLLLYSPASLTSIRANEELPSSRPLRASGVIVSAIMYSPPQIGAATHAAPAHQ